MLLTAILGISYTLCLSLSYANFMHALVLLGIPLTQILGMLLTLRLSMALSLIQSIRSPLR